MVDQAPSEATMWDKLPADNPSRMSDSEINDKYNKRELRIVTETNREQLPNFVEALNRPGWMDLRPFYQRRPRWEIERQSKLIESFIMNIPVPPLFVYESDLAKYEVMDGQQRITAIKEFYANKFPLKGLEQWPELNGRIYDKLPADVKKGIDRRSISYIVLLKESATTTDEEALLWNAFGWTESLAKAPRSRLLQKIFRRLGKPVGRVMGPFERFLERGSSYTAVFRAGASQ